MQLFDNPRPAEWAGLVKRPAQDLTTLRTRVLAIMDEVKKGGDAALLDFTRKFDGVELKALKVERSTVEAAADQLEPALREAIKVAHDNVRRFHLAQAEKREEVTTMPGVTCWREARAIERVGLYIPGGTAPLFSTVLMLALPAKIAGCQEVVLCSPPDRDTGEIHPAVLYTAGLCG